MAPALVGTVRKGLELAIGGGARYSHDGEARTEVSSWESLPATRRGVDTRPSARALQRGPIPVSEIGGGFVGALQKFEERLLRVFGAANRIIRKHEFAQGLIE